MELRTIVQEMLDYHYWARDRQLEACAALSEEEFLRPIGGSFPSIRDTLAHLVRVERLWLERWRGCAPRALPPIEEYLTLAAIAERWRTVERGVRDYAAGLTEEALCEQQSYMNLRGETSAYSRWHMFFHLINHQSYHRGQVTNLLRQLGHKPPAVDFLNSVDARA